MDPNQVLIKTPKGQDEIRTKAHRLSSRLRRLLILVDGHSSVAEIVQRLAALGDDTEAQLSSLVGDGFLAPLGGPSPSAAAAEPGERSEFNLVKAKAFARFVLLGALGPVAARRVERIDAASTAGELRVELDELREILPKLVSKREAKRIWDQLEPIMLSVT